MNTFLLNIVMDSKTVFSDQASYCGVVVSSGSMGFEAGHEPFLGVLQEDSDVSYTDNSGAKSSVNLESGIISFKNNICTITGILA